MPFFHPSATCLSLKSALAFFGGPDPKNLHMRPGEGGVSISMEEYTKDKNEVGLDEEITGKREELQVNSPSPPHPHHLTLTPPSSPPHRP